MKYGRAVGIFIATLLVVTSTRPAIAIEKPTLLIVEIQTGSINSTGEDFVELFNQSGEVIDTATWRLDYLAAGATSQWAKKATLSGNLQPGDRYLISTKDYLGDIADATFSSGLSKTGGSLRLVKAGQGQASDQVIDLIGWGTAKEFRGEDALPEPDDGSSFKRKVDEDGAFIDTLINKSDFTLSTSPSPSSSDDAVLPEDVDENTDPIGEEPNDPDPSPPAEDEESIASPTAEDDEYVQITELFVDPAAPLTDADDEFIELYNPGTKLIDLSEYILQTGLTYSHSFVIAGLKLAPGQYLALPAHETGLSISNSGGRARLVGPSGRIIDETATYEKSYIGQSFALKDGVWNWTTVVTANAVNNIVSKASESASKVAASAQTIGTKAKKVTTKTPKKSTKAAKSTSSKAATSKSSKSDSSTSPSNALASAAPHLNTRWLVGLGSLAVLYAGWEYRDDIKAKYYRLRRNRGPGSSSR